MVVLRDGRHEERRRSRELTHSDMVDVEESKQGDLEDMEKDEEVEQGTKKERRCKEEERGGGK